VTDYSKKLLFSQNLVGVIDNQIGEALQADGWELPCVVKEISADGLFVTVDFQISQGQYPIPTITIPIAESEYVRLPIQIGTVGITKKITADITYISGQQDGVSTLNSYGNLNTALCFMPISNKKLFPENANINALLLYGPEGVVIEDLSIVDGSPVTNSRVTVSQTSVRMESGTSYIQINKDGSIVIEGSSVTIMDKDFLTHHHSGVSTGSSNTGDVV